MTEILIVVSQSFNNTEKRFNELKIKVASLGPDSGALGNIHQKALSMKKDAEDLLNKASNGMKQLDSE